MLSTLMPVKRPIRPPTENLVHESEGKENISIENRSPRFTNWEASGSHGQIHQEPLQQKQKKLP